MMELSFPDRESAKIWIIRNQFGRRNLSPYQRSVLALKLEDIIRARAKARQRATLPQPGQKGFQRGANVGTTLEGKARDELASVAQVRDILARRREERMAKAWRLQMLGWTQQQTAEALGVTQDTISKDLKKTSELKISLNKTSELKKSLKSLLSQGHPIGEVARRFNLPELLVWAVALEGKSDQARFEALGWHIRPWDLWNW